jgi:S1-C subfamily serine protease
LVEAAKELRTRRTRAPRAFALAALGLVGSLAACSSTASHPDRKPKRTLAHSDAPELVGVAYQLAGISSGVTPSLARLYNETHTFKRFDRWADGLVSELLGLFKINPYYDYPYRLLRVPYYLFLGEFESGNAFGSGFFVAGAKGALYVVTNAHVIENAARLEAELVDGRRSDTEVVAVDEARDLALLKLTKLEGAPPPALRLRRSPGRPGEPLLAVGFPGRDVLTDDLLGFPKVDESDERPNPTVTLGVVSAIDVELGNPATHYLQTDAAINHGGSGGPVLDLAGQVLGVVEMIGRDSANEGYAIPTGALYEAFANELGAAPGTGETAGLGSGSRS